MSRKVLERSTHRRGTTERNCHKKQGSCVFSLSKEEKEEAGEAGGRRALEVKE